jgi:hypothetical protein
MKLLGAFLAYLAIASVLGLGIVLAVKGNYWLLGVGTLAYLLLFARIGCLPPGRSH